MTLLLLAVSALLLAVATLILVAAIVLIGWVRQDRILRRMQRDIAQRSARIGRDR